MISAINYNTNSRISFGGVVKVASVIHDGVPTQDLKIINRALKKVKKLMLMQLDTPQNTDRLSAYRKMYANFDSDYTIPQEKVVGETRHIFAKIRSGLQYFLVTGPDAADVACAGKCIGSSRKLAKLTQDTNSGRINLQKSENALSNYHSVIHNIARKFRQDPQHPTITIHTTSKFKDGVGILKINMSNDSFKLNGRQYSAFTQSVSPLGKQSTIKTKIVEKTESAPVISQPFKPIVGKNEDCNFVRKIYRKTIEEKITETFSPSTKKAQKKKNNERQMDFLDQLFK